MNDWIISFDFTSDDFSHDKAEEIRVYLDPDGRAHEAKSGEEIPPGSQVIGVRSEYVRNGECHDPTIVPSSTHANSSTGLCI
jgi:hypothetical protein